VADWIVEIDIRCEIDGILLIVLTAFPSIGRPLGSGLNP
jgi:hypothetical protein